MLTSPAHSVMPRMLRTEMPVAASKRWASSAGSGEPPVKAARTLEMFAFSGTPSRLASTVGTQASSVTRSRSQNCQ
ncbi:hypothetical protein FQZ97_1051850 [compost metagenome]